MLGFFTYRVVSDRKLKLLGILRGPKITKKIFAVFKLTGKLTIILREICIFTQK